MWRNNERERGSLMNDILKLNYELSQEKLAEEKFKKLLTSLKEVETENDKFIKENDTKIEHDFDKLNETKLASERNLEAKKKEFLELEETMWQVWDTDTFRHAFGFFLDKMLMTPQPQFPVFFANHSVEKEYFNSATTAKENILKAKLTRLEGLTRIFGNMFKKMRAADDAMLAIDMLGPLNGKLEMMKWRLNGDKNGKQLVEIVEEHQKNLATELQMQEQIAQSETISRIKVQIEKDMSNKPESRWLMRLGKPVKASSTTTRTAFSSLIPEHIVRLAKMKYDAIQLGKDRKKKALDNDKDRHGHYAKFRQYNGSNFLLTKYADFVEQIHRSLTNNGDIEKRPVTLYEETMNSLLIKP